MFNGLLLNTSHVRFKNSNRLYPGFFVPLSPSYTQTLVIVSALLNSHLTCIVSNILLRKFYTVGDDNCNMLIILVKVFSKPKYQQWLTSGNCFIQQVAKTANLVSTFFVRTL